MHSASDLRAMRKALRWYLKTDEAPAEIRSLFAPTETEVLAAVQLAAVGGRAFAEEGLDPEGLRGLLSWAIVERDWRPMRLTLRGDVLAVFMQEADQ